MPPRAQKQGTAAVFAVRVQKNAVSAAAPTSFPSREGGAIIAGLGVALMALAFAGSLDPVAPSPSITFLTASRPIVSESRLAAPDG
jgi:hypothetical protein